MEADAQTTTSADARTRAEAADAALTFIRERGRRATIDDVAATMGSSRVQLHRLFPTESDLVEAAAERYFADDLRVMEDVLSRDLSVRDRMFAFFAERFSRRLAHYRSDPDSFTVLCEVGNQEYETVRGFVELADHYLSEIIAEAQAEGYFQGLTIDQALSLINQMVLPYVWPDALMNLSERVSLEKLHIIVHAIFDGLKGRPDLATPLSVDSGRA